MSEKLQVVTLLGSLRKGSFNGMVARTLPKFAPASMEINALPSIADIPLHHRRCQNRPVRHAHPGAHTGEFHRPDATKDFDHPHHQANLQRRAPAAEVVSEHADSGVGEEHRDKAWNNQD